MKCFGKHGDLCSSKATVGSYCKVCNMKTCSNAIEIIQLRKQIVELIDRNKVLVRKLSNEIRV